MKQSRLIRGGLLALAAAFVAAAVGLALFLVGGGEEQRAGAHGPHPGLDFSIAMELQDPNAAPSAPTPDLSMPYPKENVCDTDTSTPAGDICLLDPDDVFIVKVYLNSLGDIASYSGFDVALDFTGGVQALFEDHTAVADADWWPDCTFEALSPDSVAGSVGVGCAKGIGAPSSTYLGLIATVLFQCTNSGAVTMVHAAQAATDLIEVEGVIHAESGLETLTMSCVRPTATPTPICPAPCPTATPTATATATATPTDTPTPTPTFTPTSTPTKTFTPTLTFTPTDTPTITPTPRRRTGSGAGDVNGDGFTDPVDALWLLWFDADVVSDVPIPEAADVNGDGVWDSIDALFILWIDTGVILPP